MFRYNRNAGSLMRGAFVRGSFFMLRIQKLGEEGMEGTGNYIGNKGGRPRNPVKKDQLLGVKCSLIERKVIEGKAKLANLSVSEYLRTMGVIGKIDRLEKSIPKEVLQLTGTLNHLAANLNQIAKKRNGIEELNALERAGLQVQSGVLKKLAEQIKNYLK